MKKLKRDAKKTAIVYVRTTPPQRKVLEEVAARLGISEAECVRRGIALLDEASRRTEAA